MARTRREMLLSNYGPVRRAIERWAGWTTRDAGGLPLENVYGHVENRVAAAYRILKALELAIKLGRVSDPEKLAPVGASVQTRGARDSMPRAGQAPPACFLPARRVPSSFRSAAV